MTFTTPTISICIPTYNRLDYLQQTLENIFSTFSEISHEVIVVDGGSNDGTQQYLRALHTDKQIVHIQENNIQGAARATATAYAAATGKYIIKRN